MSRSIIRNGWWLMAAALVYTLTFVFNNYWSKYSSFSSVAKSFQVRVNKQLDQFDRFCADTAHLRRLMSNDADVEDAPDAESFHYVYIHKGDSLDLKYWSTTAIIPLTDQLRNADTVLMEKRQSGIFLTAVRHMPSMGITAVQMTPLKWDHFISNEYLKVGFPGFSGAEKYMDISTEPTPYPVTVKNGRTLFYLLKTSDQTVKVFNWYSFFIEIIAGLLFMVFFYRTANELVRDRRSPAAILLVVATFLFIRTLVLRFHFPMDISEIDGLLFTISANTPPMHYTFSNMMLDLFGTLWVIRFFSTHEGTWSIAVRSFSVRKRAWIAVVSMVVMVVATFIAAGLINMIVAHPDISFNVSDFFSLGWNTFWAILLVFLIVVIHYLVLDGCTRTFNSIWPYRRVHKLFIIAFFGLLVLTVALPFLSTGMFLLVLLWLVISVILVEQLPQRFLDRVTPSTSALFWLLWYAFSCMWLVVRQIEVDELQQRTRVALKLGMRSDPIVENLLDQALKSDEVKGIPADMEVLRDSSFRSFFFKGLQDRYFSGYLGQYQTRFYMFDTSGRPIGPRDGVTFEALNTITEGSSSPTRFPGIFYYESSFDRFMYVLKQPLLLKGKVRMGTLFITCTPTLAPREALAPELLKQLEESDRDLGSNYSYAVYDKGRLVSSNKDLMFRTELSKQEIPRSQTEMRERNGREQLWYNAGGDRVVVVVRNSSSFKDGVALLAYFFGAFILFFFSYRLLLYLRRRRSGSPFFRDASIKGQIQRTVLMVSIISFFVIGLVTIYFFIDRSDRNNTEKLTKLISQVIDDLQKNPSLDRLIKERTSMSGGNAEELTLFVKKVASMQKVDINLFGPNGDLIATSQPIIYDRGIVSTKMDPVAFRQLAYGKKVRLLRSESIGTLRFSGMYLPVRTPAGETIGFLNIPYFSSQKELDQEISNFLVAIINFNALVFLLAGIVAFFITNRITSSFTLIGEKMKDIALGRKNEVIEWDRKDEIGILVDQYNKMIEELEESARKLSQTERESAWREMARQVAHEIKNPLTPMKLSLQYLQRAIANDAANVKELTSEVAQNLVEHIDHLSNIASDFSQFAQIGLTRKEVFDVCDILHQVTQLYEQSKHAQIRHHEKGKPVMVEADRTQINRLFTNLIQNACEASESKGQIILDIACQMEDDMVTVSIKDNGIGISESLSGSIFMPNFTTKSSGTGLGLAICKGIVEKAGGKIWYTTVLGEGTTFFVSLPLYHP